MPFGNVYDSDGRSFCINVKITCKGSKRFRVFAEEYGAKNCRYVDREIDVAKDRTIYLSFPVSPKQLFIGVLNVSDPADKDYEVLLIESSLQTYNIHLDWQADKFLQFAAKFSMLCGRERAETLGRNFQTADKEFRIKYFPVITDRASGAGLGTPARIGHGTGIIEVAKCKFDKYTIPMRIIILLHEFSHKYRNPRIGLEIADESGADINALYLFLGAGFSKIDAITVFAKVFLTAQTPGNMKRMRLIMDYIKRFEREEFAQKD